MPKRTVRAMAFMLAVAAPGLAWAIDLAGSEWGLGDGDPRYLQFASDGSVRGFTGCNRFIGRYEATSGGLKIQKIAMTMMACPDRETRLEREFVGILTQVEAYEAEHLKLTLYGPGHELLLQMRRRDFD
jgi:heat shock protein HslJ